MKHGYDRRLAKRRMKKAFRHDGRGGWKRYKNWLRQNKKQWEPMARRTLGLNW